MQQSKNCMKTLITCAFCLLGFCSVEAQDWEPLTFPISENITEITFIHPDTGFVVTGGGRCAATYDGAVTWYNLPVALGTPLEGVHFLNADTGIVCGRMGAIYRTLDSGNTWENHSLPDTLPWLTSVVMLDHLNGYVTGLSRTQGKPMAGIGLRTTNGGESWKPQRQIGIGYGELFLSADTSLYFQSYGKLNVSADKGKSWKSLPTGMANPTRATAILGKTGLTAGNGGAVGYSTNGGKTWTEAKHNVVAHFTSVVLVDSLVGYVGGTEGVIMKTTDGGQQWKAEKPPIKFHIYDMISSGEYLYAVGHGGGIMRKKVR
jgi:photosystem II stability/assembly factor-like uncharacterized protein